MHWIYFKVGSILVSGADALEKPPRKRSNSMNKTAIVTGASRGIGRAVAMRLAHDGFAVVVNYASNAEQADAVVAAINSTGGRAIAVKADVSNTADVERLFEETLKLFGSVDVVVNNSGIMPLSPIGKEDLEVFDKVISTNLRGTFVVLAQAAQHVASGGRIIAFSSSVLAKSFPHTDRISRRRLGSKVWFMCWRMNYAGGTFR
jgi:3-oxoacyl-[acyl-carrier protein] reductase